MWVLTTGCSQQRRILIIKWIGWPVLWIPINQPFSLAIPIITQWAHKPSSHGCKNGIYAEAQQHGLPFTETSLATDTSECPVCHPRPTLSPRYVTILQVISQQLSGGKLITLDCFQNGRGSILLSLEHLFWIQICNFLHAMLLQKHSWTYRMQHPSLWYSREFWSKNSLHSRWSSAMGPWSWNSLVLQNSPLSWNKLA